MKEEIQKFFKGDVDDSPETLKTYSHDASLFEIMPKLVVYPKDSEDIKELVRWVKENKEKDPTLSITARSAGTDMSGGAINDSIIMDFTRYMNALISLSPDRREAIVQPGMFYRNFEVETLKHGLILPCYTASKSINAIGGMVGNNSSGEKTLKYGSTRNFVKQLKVIFADGFEHVIRPLNKKELYAKVAQTDFEGKIYRELLEMINKNQDSIQKARPKVSKNSAGYDLWDIYPSAGSGQVNDQIFDLCKLIVGSQGTLGIVTEVTLSLEPVAQASKLVVIFMNSLQNLGNVVDELLVLKPESLESYDDKTFKLAMKFFKDFLKEKGVWGLIKFTLSFVPEFMMILTGGVPKLILLAEFTGDSEADVTYQAKEAKQKIAHFGFKTHITRNVREANKYWQMRRDSFALLRKHVQGRRTAPFIDDIIVPPQVLPEFLPKLNAILDKYKNIIYTIAGHAGDGNFHIIPLMDFNDPRTVPQILEISDKVYPLVVQYDGSITAEHNDGIIRTPYLELMYGVHIYSLFGEVKKIFDPQVILNPKKKVGDTIEDIRKYIIKPDAPHMTHGS